MTSISTERLEEITPELLAATSSLQGITFRANELGIGLAKYPVAEIDVVLKFVSASMAEASYCSLDQEEVVKADDDDETYEIGKRDGYENAVQDIDLLTGGDGEYRYVMGAGHDDERHTPDAETMKLRIADRFEALRKERDAALRANEALNSAIDRCRLDASAAETKLAQALAANETDRTIVHDVLHRLDKTIRERWWLNEGRGSYEWDDDRWMKEFETATKHILTAVKDLRRICADLTNTPQVHEDVEAARAGIRNTIIAGTVEIRAIGEGGTRGLTHVVPDNWWHNLPAGKHVLYLDAPRPNKEQPIAE